MDIFVLDDDYRRDSIIDTYESLIWTERYKRLGDFELLLEDNNRNRNLITRGSKLSINLSKRIMIVDTVERKRTDEDKVLLEVKGLSAEKVLVDRALLPKTWLLASPWFDYTDTPKNIVNAMFEYTCVDPITVVRDGDIIPNIGGTSQFPPDTNTGENDIIQHRSEFKSLIDAIHEITDLYDLGYRMCLNSSTSQFFFESYYGVDRTSTQSDYPAVIFSPQLNSISSSSELDSTALYKNVAYVVSKEGMKVVTEDGLDPNSDGLDWRVIFVDIEIDGEVWEPENQRLMEQKGREALSEHNRIYALDGEIPRNINYVYGVDYNVGDMVEMRNEEGLVNRMRVEEQIIISDDSGVQTYPTLSTREFITPGSWKSWEWNVDWDNAVGEWDDY